MLSRHILVLCLLFILGCGTQTRAIRPINKSHGSAYVLNLETFNDVLGNKSYALVEFYASWCPACINFAPTYDKIASYLGNTPLDSGEAVFVAKVDCAVEAKLCKKFKIDRYPTLYFGSGESFLKGVRDVQRFEGSRVPAEVVSWIAKNTKQSLVYKESVFIGKANHDQDADAKGEPIVAPENKSDWHMDDVEKATLMLFETIKGSDVSHRQAAYDLLAVFATSHPSMRCRRGIELLVEQFDEFWPSTATAVPSSFSNFTICPGADAATLQWRACKGSLRNTRGYTCGLWTLLHAVSVRLPGNDPHIGGKFVAMLRAFGENFFLCETCREHFLTMLRDFTTEGGQPSSSVGSSAVKTAAGEEEKEKEKEMEKEKENEKEGSSRLDGEESGGGEGSGRVRAQKMPKDRAEAVLMLWEMHNVVNARLAIAEANDGSKKGNDTSVAGDPAFPKEQFPSQKRCPKCHRTNAVAASGAREVDVMYDKAEVLRFLERVYGGRETDKQFEDERAQSERGFFDGKGPVALMLLVLPVSVVLVVLYMGDRRFMQASYLAAAAIRNGGRSFKGRD